MLVAYICVDVQNDFCEGGALAVEGGRNVAEAVSRLAIHMGNPEDLIFTRDWHNPPPDTNGGHFAEQPDFVDSWPVHCVAGTPGADFHPAVAPFVTDGRRVFSKGQGRPDYSGFQGVNSEGETLLSYLESKGYDMLIVFGLAGDHCVRQTALDGIHNGFTVIVHPAAIASVGGTGATWETLKQVHDIQYEGGV